MTDGLILILVVAGCYLAARLAFDWLAERYVVVSGAEYLLLGILLGPEFAGLLTRATVESFAPITSLGLGWMGARLGSQLMLPMLVRIPAVTHRIALVESLLTFAVVSGLLTLALHWQFGLTVADALVPAFTLGSIATVTTQAGVAVVTRQMRSRSPLVRQLRVTSATNAMFGVAAFGVLLAVVHPTPSQIGRPITPTEWVVISIGIGLVGGSLFHLFLGDETSIDRLFISLAGGVILVSGAATYLRLSPTFTAMFFGAVLVNTTRARNEIAAALDRVERPLYFALLVFGGAAWQPSARAWVLAVLLFLIVRTMSKIGSARLAARANGLLPVLGPDWGRGLLGQGGLALAVGLNYVYQEALPLPNVVFTTAVASLLLTDLLSARFVRSLFHLDTAGVAPGADADRAGTSEPGRETSIA